MRLFWTKAMASFFLAASLTAPAWAENSNTNPAIPGTLNYVEGKVSINGQPLTTKAIGSATLQQGQFLVTQDGKAEVLLTPGVFLRVGDNSKVELISPSIINTEVGIDSGHAMVEVDELHKENDIRVSEDGATARLEKTGLYDFDSNQQDLRVLDGKAVVEDDGRNVTVKGGHELNFAEGAPVKARKFDKKLVAQEDDLYQWSSLRSSYVAEANVDAAGAYAENGWGPWGPGWWGADWYWDPWFDAYTFIPGDGIFYSPFGWGFYSPWWVGEAPFFGYGGYGYGGYGGYGRYGHYYHHFSTNYHSWGPGSHYAGSRNYSGGIYRGAGSTGEGFHSGPRMMGEARRFGSYGGGMRSGSFGGGGFHGGGIGGGGGFHGGGFGGGGGFHGGGAAR